jgi:hypothetical protein
MMDKVVDRVIVRFKCPSGSGQKMPSAVLSQAMVSLADSDEMRPLLCEGSAEGKALAIDVYQNRAGRPILVHFTKEEL